MLFDPKGGRKQSRNEEERSVMTGGLTPKMAPNYPRSYYVRGKRGLQPLPPFPAFVTVLGHTELAPSWFPALFYVFLPGPGLPGHLEMFSSWPWPGGKRKVQEPRLIANLWFSWVPLQMGTQVRNDSAPFHQPPHPATRPTFSSLPPRVSLPSFSFSSSCRLLTRVLNQS